MTLGEKRSPGGKDLIGHGSDKRTERWLIMGIKDEGRGRSALFFRLRGHLNLSDFIPCLFTASLESQKVVPVGWIFYKVS